MEGRRRRGRGETEGEGRIKTVKGSGMDRKTEGGKEYNKKTWTDGPRQTVV